MTGLTAFHLSSDVAADTGIHLGDGSLRIKSRGPHGYYQYEVTVHALEDQLYLIGNIMPTISDAYGLQRSGYYINPEQTWISLRYQSKAVALFKRETLGLPIGRKHDLSIPIQILRDAKLMKPLARELLATDGVLGFYTAEKGGGHKYPRIQIKMTARRVIDEVSAFLQNHLGITSRCRDQTVDHTGWGKSLQRVLQISQHSDIDTWRKEIGFSNPSHISRMMVYEALGECPPRTSIDNRVAFLSGQSSKLSSLGPITRTDLVSVISRMKAEFGSPRATPSAILQKIDEINDRLSSNLGRKLPVLAQS